MHGSIHSFERLPMVDVRRGTGRGKGAPSVPAPPLIGLIRNRRSHLNEKAAPAAAVPDGVIATSPRRREEIPGILADFARQRVDCIAIDGGDGTVRDVLTCGAGVFGDSWPALIILPNGKTNALAHDLGIPAGWTLDDAAKALRAGQIARRRPLVISQRDNAKAQVRGFIIGAGAFNRAIALGQRSHDLGAFNAAVVGVTAVWSVVQALLGSARNGWRRGTRMRLRDEDGSEVPHFGGLPSDERYLLLASTLESFPAGIQPFRRIESDMGVAVLDNARRGLMLRIGALMRGTASAATLRRGAHIFGGDRFEADLGEPFILDGEAFPAGHYRIETGARLRFVVP